MPHKRGSGCFKESSKHRNTEQLILRTDNGTQFRSRAFQKYLKEIGIEHERIAVNTPEENSHIESFHGILKREEIYQKQYLNINHCKKSIAEELVSLFLDYSNYIPNAISKILHINLKICSFHYRNYLK